MAIQAQQSPGSESGLVLGPLQAQPKILAALKDRGWPLKELAKRAGVHPTSLQRWTRGEARPRTVHADAIAQVLGMEWEDLFSYERPTSAEGER